MRMSLAEQDKIHKLRFEHMVNGKKEEFLAIYDEKQAKIFLQGNMRHSLEIDELIKFLSAIRDETKEREEQQQIRGGICVCGSKNFRLIGKGVWNWAPLVGNEFDILQCESCGRQLKKITAHY
jgi:hypothetical protein